MSFNSLTLQQAEKQLRHSIVNDALVFDSAPLLGVERGRIVFEITDHQIRIGSSIKLLSLSFVEHFELLWGSFHGGLFPPKGSSTSSLYRDRQPQQGQVTYHRFHRRGFTHRQLLRARLLGQALPVWPKPPAPRFVEASFSTSTNSAWATGAITSWAMRSPGLIVTGCWPRFI